MGNSRLPVAAMVKIVPPASHRGRGTTPECIPVVRPIRELTIEVLLLNALLSGFCTLLANFIGRYILLLHILDRYNRPEIQHQGYNSCKHGKGYHKANQFLYIVSLSGFRQRISPSHIIYPCYLGCNLYLAMSEKNSDVPVTGPGPPGLTGSGWWRTTRPFPSGGLIA
jgi:hypothetical protein